jgi:putative ABC transport system permease protein
MLKIPVGWLQLKKEKMRFVVAIFGVTLAVILILMQIGFRESMLDTSLRYHELGVYDIALISPATTSLIQARPFTSRRLYQALAVKGVASVHPVYAQQSFWNDPETGESMQIFTVGFNPASPVFRIPEVNAQIDVIKKRDYFLFDRLSRPEYEPILNMFDEDGFAEARVNNRTIEVQGFFTLGTSFGINGSLISSTDNFLRLFPNRTRGMIDVGFIVLEDTADKEDVRNILDEYLPSDVSVLTKQGFKQLELDFWNTISPVGAVFGFGIIVGLVVGAIIVYQILFADVSDHMAEYATLKAMGYSNLELSVIVIQQAIILAVIGFVIGFFVCLYLYELVGGLIMVEMSMTIARACVVFFLTIIMCAVSALLAQRKVWSADPAEIF